MDTSKLSADQKSNMGAIRRNIVHILTNRVECGMGGATEAAVVAKGDKQVVVEIPGFTDAQKAIDYLKTTASIEWCRRAEREDRQRSERLYDVGEPEDYKGVPVYLPLGAAPARSSSLAPPSTSKLSVAGATPILKGDDLEKAESRTARRQLCPLMKSRPRRQAAWNPGLAEIKRPANRSRRFWTIRSSASLP